MRTRVDPRAKFARTATSDAEDDSDDFDDDDDGVKSDDDYDGLNDAEDASEAELHPVRRRSASAASRKSIDLRSPSPQPMAGDDGASSGGILTMSNSPRQLCR